MAESDVRTLVGARLTCAPGRRWAWQHWTMSRRLAIVNPCTKKTWAELPGDDRRRVCDTCNTHVHALEHCTESEQDEIWRTSPGRVCGYLTGTPSTRPSRRQVLIGALLAIASPLFAQDRVVRVVVKDESGEVVPGVEVLQLGADGTVLDRRTADESGVARWTGLPAGRHAFRVEVPGFVAVQVTAVAGTRETTVTAVLRIGTMGEVIIIPSRRRRWWLLWLK